MSFPLVGPEKTNRDSFRSNLRDGLLEENTIEIEVPSKSEKVRNYHAVTLFLKKF